VADAPLSDSTNKVDSIQKQNEQKQPACLGMKYVDQFFIGVTSALQIDD
jgi:hypothetical protein